MKEKLVQARLPEDLYREVENRVRAGYYSNKSELVREALRKMFAEENRGLLRKLTKMLGITEEEMLRDLAEIRK